MINPRIDTCMYTDSNVLPIDLVGGDVLSLKMSRAYLQRKYTYVLCTGNTVSD
jgi:hypothetical protein